MVKCQIQNFTYTYSNLSKSISNIFKEKKIEDFILLISLFTNLVWCLLIGWHIKFLQYFSRNKIEQLADTDFVGYIWLRTQIQTFSLNRWTNIKKNMKNFCVSRKIFLENKFLRIQKNNLWQQVSVAWIWKNTIEIFWAHWFKMLNN